MLDIFQTSSTCKIYYINKVAKVVHSQSDQKHNSLCYYHSSTSKPFAPLPILKSEHTKNTHTLHICWVAVCPSLTHTLPVPCHMCTLSLCFFVVVIGVHVCARVHVCVCVCVHVCLCVRERLVKQNNTILIASASDWFSDSLIYIYTCWS